MTSDVRIAIFGNGFARGTMLPALRHVPGATVVGIASPTREKVEATAREFGIEHVATDHRALLDAARPDLVFVVTPPHRHAEQSIDALDAGCHVVCEKPTALNATESERMWQVAAQHPRQLALLDHELRVHPNRIVLRNIVEAGSLGAVRHATYTITSPARRDPTTPWHWWSDVTQGGGTLGALGSHAVDTLRSLLGEVESVRGTLHTWTTERPDPRTGAPRAVTADDLAVAWLRFRSGALATMTLSLIEAERVHRLTLAGTLGAAHLDEQAPLRVQLPAEEWQDVSVPDDLPANAELGIPDTDWARSFIRYARLIVAAIADGRTEVPGASTFEDGHRNQCVLDAIRVADREHGWINVAVAGAVADVVAGAVEARQ